MMSLGSCFPSSPSLLPSFRCLISLCFFRFDSFRLFRKGIIGKQGLVDSSFDYGNAYYNDHHYHYGYFVYTASVIRYFDPSWGLLNEVLLSSVLPVLLSALTTFRFFLFCFLTFSALG
jgi:hypothetical protein